MTAKEWLMRGWELNKEIDILEMAKWRAYDRCTSKTQTLKERIHGSNSEYDSMTAYAALSEQIDTMIDKLIDLKKTTLQVVQQLDKSVYRQILIARYINFETWEAIATRLHYSYRQVCRLHGIALQAIAPIIKDYGEEHKHEFTKSR